MRFTDCISHRRTELMGCAILLIICFHSYARLPGGLWRYVVRENGNIGVDFFALMSGFGCVFSLKKDRDIGRYYARRLKRLLPPYYVALALCILVAGVPSVRTLAANLIPIGAWVGEGQTYWYVSASLLYYILIPPMRYLLDNARWPKLMFLALLGCTALLIPFVTRGVGPALAIMRLPALAAGAALGAFHHADWKKRDWWTLAALVALVWLAGFVLMRHHKMLSRAPLNLMSGSQANRLQKALRAPAIVTLMALALEGVERTPLRFVNAPLRALGRRSLELYLGHAIVRDVCMHWRGISGGRMLLVMLAASYPLALGIALGAKYLMRLVGWLPLLRRPEDPPTHDR